MNWLKRRLRNWINSEQDSIQVHSTRLSKGPDHMFDDNPLRFSVTMARGGVVVTSNVYDRVKDRNNCIIHVIHDDEDVAGRVGQIVAMELMKQ
jgi:hypothetical protein